MTGNVLFLMSDEHSREITGCYGNSMVRTPNLDALAARGALFENAYCNSPICVPSRASLATGDYVHRIGYWDSAAAYDGRVPSWHHRVREAGHDMVSIGKLHYRSPDDDCGFTEMHLPMYVVDGIGDTHGLLRRERRVREVAGERAGEAGRGTSVYTRYDTKVADATVHWIRERGERRDAVGPVLLHGVAPLSADRARRVLRPLRGRRTAAATAPRPGRASRPPRNQPPPGNLGLRRPLRRGAPPGRAHRLLRALLLPRLPDRTDPRRVSGRGCGRPRPGRPSPATRSGP